MTIGKPLPTWNRSTLLREYYNPTVEPIIIENTGIVSRLGKSLPYRTDNQLIQWLKTIHGNGPYPLIWKVDCLNRVSGFILVDDEIEFIGTV